MAGKQVNLRMEKSVIDRLKEIGSENDRDYHYYIHKAVKEFLDGYGEESKVVTKPKPVKRFVAPTDKDVHAYMVERSGDVFLSGQEASRFVDYYSSKGWKVGKSPMKDWKAAARNWLKNNFSQGKPSASDRQAQLEQMDRERGLGQVIEGEVQNDLLLGHGHD